MTDQNSPAGEALERHITAGPRALSEMAGILGLARSGRGWRLDGLCAAGRESVRLSLANGERKLSVYLLAREAPQAQVRAEGLSLAAEAAGSAMKRLLEAAGARLKGRSLGDIVGLIESDPESCSEMRLAGDAGERLRVPYIGAPIGLMEAGWRNFFGDQDFDVLLGVPDCAPNRTVNIEYADLECYYARPKRSFKVWSFLDWPEEGQDQAQGYNRDMLSVVTELEERDMILGTGEKADALVERIKKISAAGHFVVLTHLCTPIIMGEDFQGLARRCEREVGGTAVAWSQKDRDQRDNFGEFFRKVLGRPGFFDSPADSSSVNLFHFPPSCRDEEIRPFLEEIGLKVNVCLFPVVDFPSVESIPKAALQVFCEKSSQSDKVREILARSPRTVLDVRAPYGLEASRQCLGAIAAAAGREKQFEEAWSRKMAALSPSWEEMKKEAASRRLAFVVSEASLPRLLELRYGHGAPLARMVREMGFGLDLVYHDLHGEPPRLPQELSGARVAVFRGPAELESALSEGGFQAVYSDIFFDWRISRAGKARFSSKDFEMGIEGARRTFKRLLAACRLPFYRRYAPHLARARRRDHA